MTRGFFLLFLADVISIISTLVNRDEIDATRDSRPLIRFAFPREIRVTVSARKNSRVQLIILMVISVGALALHEDSKSYCLLNILLSSIYIKAFFRMFYSIARRKYNRVRTCTFKKEYILKKNICQIFKQHITYILYMRIFQSYNIF